MKAKAGIAIIITTFIIALYPNMVIYMLPVYLVGVVLVWLSEMKTITKVQWTLIPLLLWLPAVKVLYSVL